MHFATLLQILAGLGGTACGVQAVAAGCTWARRKAGSQRPYHGRHAARVVSRGGMSCMVTGQDGPRWLLRLSVPRRAGWRAWLPASSDFERRLAEQESPAVIAPHIESVIRRGRDFVMVKVAVTIAATDVAEALTAAWWAFRKAASDDLAGWDLAAATAEVKPRDG